MSDLPGGRTGEVTQSHWRVEGPVLHVQAEPKKNSRFRPGGPASPRLECEAGLDASDLDKPLRVARVFAERLQRATNKPAALDAFHWAAVELDLPGDILVAEVPSLREDFLPLVRLQHWGGTWFARYLRLNYIHNDPIVAHARTSWDGFSWNEILVGPLLDPKERQIILEARRAGILNAYTVPVHGPDMKLTFVSFATNEDAPGPAVRDALSAIARKLERWFRIHDPRLHERIPARPVRQLSPKELECLYWTMEGHVSKEIAYATGLSARTVDQYIRSAVEKLEARNRVDAAFRAARLGLIRKT